MKFIRIFIVVVALCITSHQASAGWWGNDDQDKQQIEQLQEQLQEQQDKGSGMVVIIAALSIGCVVVLLVGCAVGSKCRRDYTKGGVGHE